MTSRLLAQATSWITTAAVRHGDSLPDELMRRLSLTRRSALGLLRQLEAAQWLVRSGSPRHPGWRPGPLRQMVQTYALDGLMEDEPWAQDYAPFLALQPNVARLAQHAFSELLNNAIDHSGGSAVTVSVRQTAMHLQMLVSDDGCGLFERIARHHRIDDPQLAMFELAKGKLTTQPDQHSGHGLHVTTRLADFFHVHANHQAFQRSGEQARWSRSRPVERMGTSVYLAISLDTPRTLDDVLRSCSVERGYTFDSTVVPLRLLLGENIGLESRAQAKRVASRLPSFRRAEIDFSGIADIGHGFADELFRVFERQHPSLQVVPTGMAPRVGAMVESIRSAA